MNHPLVSVICLCYNHEQFVEEAIQSVISQTYPNIQLVIVDDHSLDRSAEKIRGMLKRVPSAEFIALPNNLGNCRAFNKGLDRAKGEFIIDLAADDVLMPQRVEKGVRALQSAGDRVGLNFTDAELINEKGETLGFHSDRFPHASIPQGDIYCEILTRYFINSPTMMIRKAVFEKLGGYDESLAYEDFDLWVRSSRDFEYCYTPEALIRRRVLGTSLGRKQYSFGTLQLRSTLKVCEKARFLNRSAKEHAALKKRIRYEIRQALRLGEMAVVWDYWMLLRKLPG